MRFHLQATEVPHPICSSPRASNCGSRTSYSTVRTHSLGATSSHLQESKATCPSGEHQELEEGFKVSLTWATQVWWKLLFPRRRTPQPVSLAHQDSQTQLCDSVHQVPAHIQRRPFYQRCLVVLALRRFWPLIGMDNTVTVASINRQDCLRSCRNSHAISSFGVSSD